MRNLVSVITRYENAAKFFCLTSQNQKETAGIPEYARKGKAALSRENFSLQGEQEPSLVFRNGDLPGNTHFPDTQVPRGGAWFRVGLELHLLLSTYTLLIQLVSLYRDLPSIGCFTCKMRNSPLEPIFSAHFFPPQVFKICSPPRLHNQSLRKGRFSPEHLTFCFLSCDR